MGHSRHPLKQWQRPFVIEPDGNISYQSPPPIPSSISTVQFLQFNSRSDSLPKATLPVRNLTLSVEDGSLTRRHFLGLSSGAAAVACLSKGERAQAAVGRTAIPPLIIDCHAHLYSDDE